MFGDGSGGRERPLDLMKILDRPFRPAGEGKARQSSKGCICSKQIFLILFLLEWQRKQVTCEFLICNGSRISGAGGIQIN